MINDIPPSPKATARLVVTMPPKPSRLADALADDIASDYVALTDTTDAFRHLASLAQERFVIMIPYIDRVGAAWAANLFAATSANARLLILRDTSQLIACGIDGKRLEAGATHILEYGGADSGNETFHAKIVLADGVAAYVGSANLLRRSRSINLECGMLVEGPAVSAVKMVVDAVATFAAPAELYSKR